MMTRLNMDRAQPGRAGRRLRQRRAPRFKKRAGHATATILLAGLLASVIPHTSAERPAGASTDSGGTLQATDAFVAMTNGPPMALALPDPGRRQKSDFARHVMGPAQKGDLALPEFGVAVAMVRDDGEAQAIWRELDERYPELLARRSARLSLVASSKDATAYRLVAGPFASRHEAHIACEYMADRNSACSVVPFSGWPLPPVAMARLTHDDPAPASAPPVPRPRLPPSAAVIAPAAADGSGR